jgi:hypothetical protein
MINLHTSQTYIEVGQKTSKLCVQNVRDCFMHARPLARMEYAFAHFDVNLYPTLNYRINIFLRYEKVKNMKIRL